MSSITDRGARETSRFVAWMSILGASWWLLGWSSAAPLTTPPLGSWTGLTDWVHQRSEADIAVVAIRLAGQTMVLHLGALSVIGASLRLFDVMSPLWLARLTPRWLTRLLDSSLGLGLVVTLGVASPSLSPSTAAAAGEGPGEPSSTPTMRVVETEPLTMTPLPRSVSDRPIEGSEVTEAPAPRSWVTEPGDHLWSIAAETLADEYDISPTDEQVESFWSELIEHNRHRLIDPSNPDLILPGQVFELPVVDGSGW